MAIRVILQPKFHVTQAQAIENQPLNACSEKCAHTMAFLTAKPPTCIWPVTPPRQLHNRPPGVQLAHRVQPVQSMPSIWCL